MGRKKEEEGAKAPAWPPADRVWRRRGGEGRYSLLPRPARSPDIADPPLAGAAILKTKKLGEK